MTKLTNSEDPIFPKLKNKKGMLINISIKNLKFRMKLTNLEDQMFPKLKNKISFVN